MKVFLSLFLVIFSGTVIAQKLPGDSLLANERSIDRPITVHDGQLRVTGQYALSIASREFDAYGEMITLRNSASASVTHRFVVDVKFGLTEFIQFSTALARTEHVIKEETKYIYPQGPEPVIEHQIFNDYSGFEDLYVGLDFRAPLKTRKVDLALTLGAHIPTSRFEAERPHHSFEESGAEGEALHRFTYRYNYAPGRGVTVVRMGGMAKYRSRQWAMSGRIDYEHALVEGNGIDWIHQFTPESGFEYRSVPYSYRLPDSFSYFLEAEYQPRPSLDIFLNASGLTAFRGWVASTDDLKVAIPYRTIAILSTGAEVLVTPRLWLRGRASMAVAGKNIEAPIGVEATIMYNVFPF